ncbi:MFS transporter [Pseudomonas taeanensis]|uniref:MFS transporter n=1 Tax=Pseudomonas taeanensis TaxID=574962 RepID=UPI003899CC7D
MPLGSNARAVCSGTFIGTLCYGPVSGRYGRRLPLLFGLALYSLASLLLAGSERVGALIDGRLLQGCAGRVTVCSWTTTRALGRSASPRPSRADSLTSETVGHIVKHMVAGACGVRQQTRGHAEVIAYIGQITHRLGQLENNWIQVEGKRAPARP